MVALVQGFIDKAGRLIHAPNGGIPARDVKHFSRLDESRWSRSQWRDYWRDGRAQMIPQIEGASMLEPIPTSFYGTPAWRSVESVGLKAIGEVIRWDMYHYRAYPAAGSTELTFFNQDEGAAANGRADTNLRTAGSFPGGEMMIVASMAVRGIPAQGDVTGTPTALEEWYNVYLTNAWAEFEVAGKNYGVWAPLTMLPEGGGLMGVSGGLLTFSYFQNGHPSHASLFQINPPIGIPPTIAFGGALKWRALQTVTAAGRIGMIGGGWKLRLVL